MSGGSGILILTREPDIAETITSVVGERSDAHRQILGVCRDIPGLHARMDRDPASIVLIDVDPEPSRMLIELDQVINRYPSTRFVLLSHEVRQEWLLQAMQAGARHYMMKQSVAAELSDVLDRIAPGVTPNGQAKQSKCAVITVAGTAGGCGATTLAVNLADELRLSGSGSSIILDMDCCYGSVAAHLGIEGSYGLSDVLREGRPIDAELVRTTVIHAGGEPDDRLDVLLNPAAMQPAEPARVDFTHLQKLLRACREDYRWIIVDAPRLPLDVLAQLSQASLATLMPFQMNVNDLRIAKAILSGLLRYGISSDSVVPIASRHRKRYGMLALQDVQRALGHQHIGVISNDFKSAQTAVNYGQPLSQCAPRSTLRRDVRSLASSLVEAHTKNSPVREW